MSNSNYSTIVDGKKRIVRKPTISTEDEFDGKYKGFYINISREEMPDHFYVKVYNPEVAFGTIYDGYFTENDHIIRCVKAGLPISDFTIEAAIQDAIRNILL